MDNKEKISIGQFSCIVFLYLVGTSFIYIFEISLAGRDAWIANAIAALAGISVIWFVITMSRLYPGLNFGQCLEKAFGKLVGKLISFVYFFYCAYWCSLVLQNLSELLATASLPDIDRSVFAFTIILLTIYIIVSGAEVMGRLSEIFFGIFMILAIVLTMLEIKDLDWLNTLPLFSEGIKPVIKATWPAFSLPYGEVFILVSILPFVGKVNKTGKVYFMYALASIIVVLGRLMPLLVFGAPLAKRLVFPILETVRIIHIGRFVERIEVFLLLIWVVTAVIKVMVILYSTFSIFCTTFSIKENNHLLVPIGILVVALERVSYKSLAEAGFFVSYIWPYFTFIFRFIIPFVLLIIAFIQNRKKKRGNSKAGAESEAA